MLTATHEPCDTMRGRTTDDDDEPRRNDAHAALQSAVAELEAAPPRWPQTRTIQAAWNVGCAETPRLCELAIGKSLDDLEHASSGSKRAAAFRRPKSVSSSVAGCGPVRRRAMRETLERLIDEFHERELPRPRPREIEVVRLPGNATVIVGMRRAGRAAREPRLPCTCAAPGWNPTTT